MQHNILPEFDGEFGHELDRAIPHAYKLYKEGRLSKIKYMKGLDIIYETIFPKYLLESVDEYRRSPGNGRSGWDRIIGHDNHRKISSFPWEAPSWKGKFKHIQINFPFKIDKKLLIIHNKYTSEWNGPPVNFINSHIIKKLCDLLSTKYTIIIIHPFPNAKGYTNDEQKVLDFEYKEQNTIQKIMMSNPDLDYNSVQFALHDMCDKFISIQGGSSRIASIFGGINIILHIRGSEIEHDEYNLVLSKMSNVEIHVVSNYDKLIEKTKELFIV